MSAANVTLREIDLSTRVPSFPGVFGGVVLAAVKGPIDQPYLATSESQFLRKFTPHERIKVGYDLGYFSCMNFLQQSNRLWVKRVHNGALWGGVTLRARGGADVTSSNLTSFTFVSGTDDGFDFTINGGTEINLLFGSATLSTQEVVDAINAVVTVNSDESAFAVANTDGSFTLRPENSLDINATSTSLTILGLTVGDTTSSANAAISVGMPDPELYTFGGTSPDDECVFIFAKDPGDWNNDIGITIHTEFRTADKIKEPDSFLIGVYQKTEDLAYWNLVESFECTRVIGQKDGFGRSMYIEDALATSEYISAIDNIAIDEKTQPKQSASILQFASGDDGAAVTDGGMILGLDDFQNPEDKPLTLIMDGGWATPAYQLELLKLAEKRIGTLAIISVPYSKEASANYINDIIEYRKYDFNQSSSWIAIYTPHAKIYDKFNDRALYVSPDGFIGAVISFTAANYEMWFPPAGFRRGMLRVLDLRRRYSRGEMDILYDNGINPLRFAPGRGILAWGQKTMLARPSALDRVNVRLLLIVIEPAIMEALEDFIFELNDDVTRALAKSMIDSYMEDIKARRGVLDFQCIIDETNNSDVDIDNNRMNVWLFVKPAKSVEFIKFSVIITRTGMSFSLAAEAL